MKTLKILAVLLVGLTLAPRSLANSAVVVNDRDGSWLFLASGAPTSDVLKTAAARFKQMFGRNPTRGGYQTENKWTGERFNAVVVNYTRKRIGFGLGFFRREDAVAAASHDAGVRNGDAAITRATWRDNGSMNQGKVEGPQF